MNTKKIVDIGGIAPLTRDEENQLKGGFGNVPASVSELEADGNVNCTKGDGENDWCVNWNCGGCSCTNSSSPAPTR